MNHPEQESQTNGGNAGDAQNELTGHLYDGIQEYDNPLPGWWKWLFVATILFSFPYYAYYHFGNETRSVASSYQVAEAINARKQLAGLGEIRPDRATLIRFTSEGGGAIAVGRAIYQANCIACHGANGGGLVGPNLTDDHYKNIKEIEDILTVINNGASGGAMPAWQNRLEEADRILVSAYVASLRGQDPGAGARPAEGNVIAPWPTEVEEATEETEGESDTEEAPAEASGDAAPSEDSSGETSSDEDAAAEPAQP